MRRLLGIVVLAMAVVLPMNAQTSEDEYSQEMRKSIELQHAKRTLSETMRLQMQTLVSKGLLTDDKLQDVVDEMVQAMYPHLMKKLDALYREYFTLDELKEMNAYLASPVGQKGIMLTPLAANEGAKVAQMPEVQAEIMRIVQKYVGK